jgi:hypothetical protein
MSVTPSFVRAAQATATKEPLDAIEAFAFARPAMAMSTACRFSPLSGLGAIIQASSTTLAIPIKVPGILTAFSLRCPQKMNRTPN